MRTPPEILITLCFYSITSVHCHRCRRIVAVDPRRDMIIRVALEFSSAQCRVVDSYLVYCARKILPVNSVIAESAKDWSTLRSASLCTVFICAPFTCKHRMTNCFLSR